jgi:hypothetical protein
MKGIALASILAALAGCSTYQVHNNMSAPLPQTMASRVQVLYSPPQRTYESVGIVSAKRYKPGWTDPSISDAIPQLQAAGAALGADAVIVRSDRALNDRHIVVEAEAIRYTDGKGNAANSSTLPPTGECVSCAKIGGG